MIRHVTIALAALSSAMAIAAFGCGDSFSTSDGANPGADGAAADSTHEAPTTSPDASSDSTPIGPPLKYNDIADPSSGPSSI